VFSPSVLFRHAIVSLLWKGSFVKCNVVVGNAMPPEEHFTSEAPATKEPNMQLDLPEPIAAYFTAEGDKIASLEIIP
jgi:hypothetical protein